MTRTYRWAAMTAAAFLVAIYAIFTALTAAGGSGVAAQMYATSSVGALSHFLGGAIVMTAGALQFNTKLRDRHLRWHRWLGRIYVAGVLIGGVAGFYLAFHTHAGLVARFGFALLALCWLGTTWVAYRQIRCGNVEIHRAWMVRSYALTLAAVTLRIEIPLFLMSGVSFDEAYPVIAWLCWVPNLLVAEWLIIASPEFGPSSRA